jgi:hypothetical protein
MKFFAKLLVLGLAVEGTVASTWFSKAGEFMRSLSCLLVHLLVGFT